MALTTVPRQLSIVQITPRVRVVPIVHGGAIGVRPMRNVMQSFQCRDVHLVLTVMPLIDVNDWNQKGWKILVYFQVHHSLALDR